MADAPASLGDFFAKKAKKKIKGANMNNESTTKADEEVNTKKKKNKAEDEWEEEQVVETTMNVAAVGRLTREDEEKDDDEESKRKAWGGAGKVKASAAQPLNEKRFPTLAKSVIGPSSNINIDDGSGGAINIKTSKNVYAALADENDEDEGISKRPKHIKPAMVSKVKGEFESVAIKREVDKYTKSDKPKKKGKKEQENSDDEEEDEEEEAAAAEEEENVKRPSKPKKKVKEAEEEVEEKEIAEDCKIAPDEKASRAKYIGKAKLETKSLPKRELEVEKKAPVTISKKKKKFMEDQEADAPKKMLVADWD